jgi:hypothetical protein
MVQSFFSAIRQKRGFPHARFPDFLRCEVGLPRPQIPSAGALLLLWCQLSFCPDSNIHVATLTHSRNELIIGIRSAILNDQVSRLIVAVLFTTHGHALRKRNAVWDLTRKRETPQGIPRFMNLVQRILCSNRNLVLRQR